MIVTDHGVPGCCQPCWHAQVLCACSRPSPCHAQSWTDNLPCVSASPAEHTHTHSNNSTHTVRVRRQQMPHTGVQQAAQSSCFQAAAAARDAAEWASPCPGLWPGTAVSPIVKHSPHACGRCVCSPGPEPGSALQQIENQTCAWSETLTTLINVVLWLSVCMLELAAQGAD